MATKASAELAVVPKHDFSDFDVALVKLNDLGTEAADLNQRARDLKITDKVTFDKADAALKDLKAKKKLAPTYLLEQKTMADGVVKFCNQESNRVANRLEEAIGIVNAKMAEYNAQENARAEAERQRGQAQLDLNTAQEAEAQKQKDIAAAAALKEQRINAIRIQLKQRKITKAQAEKLLKEAGAMEEAAKVAASIKAQGTVASGPRLDVAANTTRQGRTTYHAECADPEYFIREFVKRFEMGDMSLLPFITVSDQKLNERAKEVESDEKMAMMYPGVRAWSDNTF